LKPTKTRNKQVQNSTLSIISDDLVNQHAVLEGNHDHSHV